MTNSDGGSGLVNEIMQAIAGAYDWPGSRPTIIVPVDVNAETLREYSAWRIMVAVDESELVGDALQRLYTEHRLPPDGGEREPWFHVRLGPLNIPLPNLPARQRAVFIHDVNHILTGYNAVFSDGEMSIAAFEVGAGCGRVWVAWFLNLSLMAIGVLLQPRTVFRAFVRGRRARSLYVLPMDRATLRQMTVGTVRRWICLDECPLAPRPTDYVCFCFWVALTWLIIIGAATALFAMASWSATRLLG